MWLACVAVRAARSTRAVTALARRERAALGRGDDGLVVAEAAHVVDAGGAVALRALDHADVGDLAAAGRVERATRRA